MALISIFSGCTSFNNEGIAIPSIEEKELRSKYKIYVNEDETIDNENNFLLAIQDKFKNGAYLNYEIIKKDNTNDILISNNQNFNVSGHSNLASRPIINISLEDIKNMKKNTSYINKDIKVKNDFVVKNRMLVSKNTYNNQLEVFIAYSNIINILNYNLGKELAPKYGQQYLVLDGDLLRENRLGLIPLTKVFSSKKKIENALELSGYKISKDSINADKIIGINTLNFAILRYLTPKKEIKQNNKVSDSNISILANSSSNNSIGIAGGLLFLNLFEGNKFETNKIAYQNIITVYNNKNDSLKQKSILLPKLQLFKELKNINDDYSSNERNYTFSLMANSAVYFLETGRKYYSSDKVIQNAAENYRGLLSEKK